MFDRTESFTVRPATVDDISVLAHHRAAMFHDMGTLAEHQMEPLERATASYLRDAMPRGEYLAWVAEARDTQRLIVGGAGVQLRSILPRPRPGSDNLELGPVRIWNRSRSFRVH
jgi:hypothetical protein